MPIGARLDHVCGDQFRHRAYNGFGPGNLADALGHQVGHLVNVAVGAVVADQDFHGQEPLLNPDAEASWDAGFGKGESNHHAKAARSTTSASQLVRERGLETVSGVFFWANRRDEESWST